SPQRACARLRLVSLCRWATTATRIPGECARHPAGHGKPARDARVNTWRPCPCGRMRESRAVSVWLQEEIDRLEASLRDETDLVLGSLRGSIGALDAQDVELANEVIAFDDEVDRCFLGIQEGIHTLLARQTPVAVDLRHVLAMLLVNLHLERMADYCVTIA